MCIRDRCIAGLETPDGGTVTGVPERIGFVFQEDRLCLGLDAVENVRLVTGRRMTVTDIEAQLTELGLDTCLHQRTEELDVYKRQVRMNRDCEDKSPGSPMAPMPRLYSSSGRVGAKRFSGGFGDRWA